MDPPLPPERPPEFAGPPPDVKPWDYYKTLAPVAIAPPPDVKPWDYYKGLQGQGGSPNADEQPSLESPGWLQQIDNFGRLAANAATFGMADRFAGGMDAATGRASSYDAGLRKNLAHSEQARKDLGTVGSIAADLTGGGAAFAMLPGMSAGLGAGASLGSRVGASAVDAGLFGAAQGAGNTYSGDVPDYVQNAALGGVASAALGGALPLAGAGIAKGYQAVAPMMAAPIPGYSRTGSNFMRREAELDRAGLQALPNNPEISLLEGGPNMVGAAAGAIVDPTHAQPLLQALKDRQTATGPRIRSFADATFGPAEDPAAVKDALLAQKSVADAQNYNPILRAAPPIDTTHILANIDTALQQASNGSLEQKALLSLQKQMLVERDVPHLVNGRPVIEASTGQPVMVKAVVPEDRAAVLHKIKGEIDAATRYDPIGAGGLEVPSGAVNRQQGAFKQIRTQINEAIKAAVPGYAHANAVSRDFYKQLEALDAGVNIFSSGPTAVPPQRLAAMMQGMSPATESALYTGARASLDNTLGANTHELGAVRSLMGKEYNEQKAAKIFGRQRVDALLGKTDYEQGLTETNRYLTTGARTAPMHAAAQRVAAAGRYELPSNLTWLGLGAKGAQGLLNMTVGDVNSDIARMAMLRGPAALSMRDQLLANGPRQAARARMLEALIGHRRGLAPLAMGANAAVGGF